MEMRILYLLLLSNWIFVAAMVDPIIELNDKVNALNLTTTELKAANKVLQDHVDSLQKYVNSLHLLDHFDSLQKEVDSLRKNVTTDEAEIDSNTDRLSDLHEYDSWRLGMNLNPDDGHIMGYATGWAEGNDIGDISTAFTKDYLNSTVWRQPADYIAIVRHTAGDIDALKMWKFTEPGKSLLERFQAMNPGRVIATTGGHIQKHIFRHAENLEDDPIFGVDGDLALNWGNGWRCGNRILLTGGHLSAADAINDYNTHGLGNDYNISATTGNLRSKTLNHEISIIQNCTPTIPSSGCKVMVQGKDHGSSSFFKEIPVYGNYAIYVSVSGFRFDIFDKLEAELWF